MSTIHNRVSRFPLRHATLRVFADVFYEVYVASLPETVLHDLKDNVDASLFEDWCWSYLPEPESLGALKKVTEFDVRIVENYVEVVMAQWSPNSDLGVLVDLRDRATYGGPPIEVEDHEVCGILATRFALKFQAALMDAFVDVHRGCFKKHCVALMNMGVDLVAEFTTQVVATWHFFPRFPYAVNNAQPEIRSGGVH